MLWPKKNSFKEFDEKKFLRLENSPPLPAASLTFLMVRPEEFCMGKSRSPTNFRRL